MTDLRNIEEEANRVLALNLMNGGACDFCSRALDGHETVWRTNAAVSMRMTFEDRNGNVEKINRNYGTGWACCEECDLIVSLRDPEVLRDHVMQFASVGEERFDRETSATLLTLYEALFENGLHRESSPASEQRVVTREDAAARVRLCMEQARGLNSSREELGLVPGDPDDFMIVRRVMALFSEAERLDKRWGIGIFTEDDHATMRQFHAALQKATALMAELSRSQRIKERQASRPPDAAPAERVCSSCGKKPARVDDLCKRCAHAAGVLPKGKIT